MITTPFGPIKLYADGVALEYQETAHHYDRAPVKGRPLAGCYRLRIPAGRHRAIRCEVEWNDIAICNTGASGERYLDTEFISGKTILTIGGEDENPAFETVRTEHGMEYRILGFINEVVFGIAWATDYEGASDCRTWYAADPTLDK